MIVIVKCGFDSLENHSPYYYEFVGYEEDEELADKWVEENDKKLHKFKGWDGHIYPTYIKLHIGKPKQDGAFAHFDNVGNVYQYDTKRQSFVKINRQPLDK